jgi:sugar transferase EpsL
MPVFNTRGQAYRGKRALDLFLLSLLAPLLLPVLAVLALVTRGHMGSPIFFRQARAGWGGQPFDILKFRTMRPCSSEPGSSNRDEDRLTSFGRWLRSTSLDELPEVINIFRGEMSFVGPRPLHAHYVELYTPRQRRRLEVTPGLTGLAQVSGRNAIGWEARFELDVAYVEGASLRMDFAILIRTFLAVLSRRGIDAADGGVMPEFIGSQVGDAK